MKRVRFRDPAGSVRTGEWVDADGAPADTATAGDGGVIRFAGRTYGPAAVDILPPCKPTKIVCIGRNYADHAAEMGGDVPDRPQLFLKPPSAVASHGSDVPLPAGKERVDYEAELGVVVGKQCRRRRRVRPRSRRVPSRLARGRRSRDSRRRWAVSGDRKSVV